MVWQAESVVEQAASGTMNWAVPLPHTYLTQHPAQPTIQRPALPAPANIGAGGFAPPVIPAPANARAGRADPAVNGAANPPVEQHIQHWVAGPDPLFADIAARGVQVQIVKAKIRAGTAQASVDDQGIPCCLSWTVHGM